MNNEKSLYSSQNYVIKAISILSNMANSIVKASDADNGGSFDRVSLVRSCLNTITHLSHISAVYKKKKTQPKKYSSFRLSCPLWTKTRYHTSQN